MPEILEVLHLSDEHGVAKMEIRRSRIEPDLHDERLPGGRGSLEFDSELGGADNIHASLGEVSELLVDSHNG